MEMEPLLEAAKEYLIYGKKFKELANKKKRVRETLEEVEDSFEAFCKKPRNDEMRVERTNTLCQLKYTLNAIEDQEQQSYIELARIRQKYITLWEEPRYQTKKQIDLEIERNGYIETTRFSSLFRTLDPNNKLVQYRANLPIERSIFSIPACTLPLPLRYDTNQLCLYTGSIAADVWHYLLDQGFIKEKSVLCRIRILSVSFAIIVNSMKSFITGYHFVL